MSMLNRGAVMVLETTGCQTGRRRFTPVGYWQEEGALVAGAGAAGMTTVPDWVKNLRHDPHAAVWRGRERKFVVAHELMGDDRDRAQARATVLWPPVARYEQMSGRLIPFFRLVPAVEP